MTKFLEVHGVNGHRVLCNFEHVTAFVDLAEFPKRKVHEGAHTKLVLLGYTTKQEHILLCRETYEDLKQQLEGGTDGKV